MRLISKENMSGYGDVTLAKVKSMAEKIEITDDKSLATIKVKRNSFWNYYYQWRKRLHGNGVRLSNHK